MSPQLQVSIGRMREWFHLLGELRELAHDPLARRQHAVRSLGRLLDADHAYLVLADRFEAHAPMRVAALTPGDVGCSLVDHTFLNGIEDPALARMKQRAEPLQTMRPTDVMSAADWERGSFFNEYRRPAGIRDILHSSKRRRHAPPQGIGLYRRGRPFTHGERAQLHVFHESFDWDPLALPALSPRERDVFRCLLTGDSEKQIADALGLARATVHKYVTTVFRRFRVSSRAELMARCLRARE